MAPLAGEGPLILLILRTACPLLGESVILPMVNGEVTQILEAIERDDGSASAKTLLPLVYEELRRLAAQRMAKESPAHTLQPTALVHEAWLRLTGEEHGWKNRGHFLAAAAEAMRRILIDSARRKKRVKHGGELQRVELEELEDPTRASEDLLLRVHEALDALEKKDASAAELVKLRFFTGLTQEEAALARGISDRTVRRHWRFARAWLYRELCQEGN